MRILVLGGFGNFGARICRALVSRNIGVIAASRNPERFRRACSFSADISEAAIDIMQPQLADTLRALAPDLIIHCAGPFQEQNYRVAEASILANAHYIDLADARTFVANFSAHTDAKARAANLLAVTGASTLPGLSSAVINSLADGLTSLDEIQISIAPAQRSPRGRATLQAVFGYAGKPFLWFENGKWSQAYGWQELRRLHFAELGMRWAAACDVPDLELFPSRYPGVRTVQFRASLEFGWEHFVLATVSGLRRVGIHLPIERWPTIVNRAISTVDRFGGENGGMLVSVTGTHANKGRVRRDWHLTAGWKHGPEIPCMPAILIAEKLSQGTLAIRGATACMDLLTLGDFAPEFRRWNIRTETCEAPL